ncbi:MAG: hypothetical protein ACRCWG_18190 [Sarcina sp.]
MEFLSLKKYSNDFFNFIYCNDENLIYTTKRKLNKKDIFYICNYDIKKDFEYVIKSFEIEEKSYYDYKVFCSDSSLFILNKKNNILNVSKIENFFYNKKEELFSIYLEGEIKHINILNKRYFIVFIEKADFLGSQFRKYRSSKSFRYKFSYLVDLEEVESFFIKDTKFVLGARDYIQLENIMDEEVLFFEEAYREAWEKEFYYFKGLFDREKKIKQENSINYIKFSDFVDSIKRGDQRLNFKIIDSINKEGTVRYLGRTETFLYYRKKFFEKEREFIYSFEKKTGKMNEVCKIEHDKWLGEFYYDSDKVMVFYEEELGDYNKILGVFNKSCDITYNKDLGEFEDFLENRYLITYYSDDDDGNIIDCAVVRDTVDNKEYQYDGCIRCFKDYVILY